MSEPIYALPLRALDHRLLWWLLSHQVISGEGRPTGLVRGPWREQARSDLKSHRPQMWAAEKRLREAGVIISEPYAHDIRIDGRAFE